MNRQEVSFKQDGLVKSSISVVVDLKRQFAASASVLYPMLPMPSGLEVKDYSDYARNSAKEI